MKRFEVPTSQHHEGRGDLGARPSASAKWPETRERKTLVPLDEIISP
jgi:hypothetical protein